VDIAVVDLGQATLHVTDVNAVAEVFLILLLLGRDVRNKRLDKLDELGHGESFRKVGDLIIGVYPRSAIRVAN
jgi:hypothetical protein